MSAYGNLAGARTNIGRSLSNITGLGIEMEYGKEGRIAGQMEQSRIQRFTEAVGLGLESVQQIAGLGVQAQKEAARAKEMGTLSGKGAQQTVGETKLWDLLRGKADIGPGETWWGEVGERVGTGLGFMDREYDIGGSAYTSSQIEAGLPYAKLGKDWEDVSKLMGGGTAMPGIKGTSSISPSEKSIFSGLSQEMQERYLKWANEPGRTRRHLSEWFASPEYLQ
tara:strand:- start:412 stop:1080 length:669 start_codon:yes stop_codon:yes gene_type:complete